MRLTGVPQRRLRSWATAVQLGPGLMLLVSPTTSPVAARVADEIYRHYASAPSSSGRDDQLDLAQRIEPAFDWCDPPSGFADLEGVVASGQRGVLELHLGRLGVCFIRIEAASALAQNHLDVISDAASDRSRFRTVGVGGS